MDINALKSFVVVAETLNFTTAAARRNTVQSAISAHINKLEDDLGRRLIDRGRGQSMSLTAEGQTLVVYAKRLLALADEAGETIRTAQDRRVLRLGTTVTLAMSIVSDVLAQFAQTLPDVQIHIQCDRSDALLDRLEADEVDVAFMLDQGRRDDRAFTQSQRLAWVCSESFELGSNDTVPLAFLSDGRDLRRFALRALDQAGRNGQVSHLSPHPIGVRAFVQSGLALTVMPQGSVVPPLKRAPAALELPALGSIALSAYAQHHGTNPDVEVLLHLLEDASVIDR